MSSYMGVLLLCGALPLLLSFYKPFGLRDNLKAIAKSVGLVVLGFGAWDVFATYRGHWYFEPSRVYGIDVINLPLEEVLFFVVIPFCSILTWQMLLFMAKAKK